MTITITVVGDFADPLSFLASQRVEQLASLGLVDVRWVAVEADRGRPLAGRPLSAEDAARAAELSLPGETLPGAGQQVASSRAATSAYAESLSDGVPDAMRRALFDALWVRHLRVDDPEVIRGLVFDVLNPSPPVHDVARRRRDNEAVVALGSGDEGAISRQLGVVVTLARGPLTTSGQERLDRWRRLWLDHGAAALPLLVTELGEPCSGEAALRWLAARLPHAVPAAAPTADVLA